MRIGLASLPGAGRSTLLAAAGAWADIHVHRASAGGSPVGSGSGPGTGARVGGAAGAQQIVARIPDERVDWLAQRLRPKKVTYATAEWVELPPLAPAHLQALHRVDLVVFVVRAFDPGQSAVPHPLGRVDPAADFERLWQEWLLLDWGVVQSRLERLQAAPSVPRAQRRNLEQEADVLRRCLQALEAGAPLRRADLSEADRAVLQGFSLVTFLPTLVAVTIDEPQQAPPPSRPNGSARKPTAGGGEAAASRDGEAGRPHAGQPGPGSAGSGPDPGHTRLRELAAGRCEAVVEVPARLELELAQLDPETRRAFMQELEIRRPLGVERLAAAAYEACELISFLTAGEQEVRAWTIRRGTVAREAAGKVHSDMARGFIRAEVVAFDDLRRAGSVAKAREAGLLRLEGKDYVVQDGDVIEFRFHV